MKAYQGSNGKAHKGIEGFETSFELRA